MQTKIVLVLLLIVVTAFFYLHTVNPVDVTFYIAEGWVFVLPVTVFLFAGFFAGVVLTVFNIIVFDIRRGIKTLISKRNQKALVHSGEDSMEGELARLKGDPARAEELFKRSYELNSSNRTALFSLVDLYVEEEKFTEAYALVEGELGDDSGDLVLLFKLVDAALNAEDMDKAERTLEAILRVDNDNPIALKHLRAINERCEAWEEAASIQKTLLKQIKQPSEDDLRLYAAYNFEAAKVSMDGGELDDAKEKVKVSLKAEPDFIPSLVLRGEIEVRKGNVEAAIEKWLTAFNEYGDPVLLIFIEDLLLTESSPERALLIYKEATEASPLDTTLKLLFASFMLRLEMV
ncbi:MAG: tetratricopeptide repeat protein, partial [Deltaproteobacteria bacterium]|nr:tetratricopeptide repeat protein [Deltaproteobacteria bacterium]